MFDPSMDPSLIQDFLTESNELIEKLDADLVTLETMDDPSQSKELLDEIFRALHTIKGAASFLAMTDLTTFAHTAEDALNRLRKGEIAISSPIMDAMLRSVDVLRNMLEQVASSQPITPGPDDLIDQLKKIVQQDAQSTDQPTDETPPQADDHAQTNPDEQPLQLPPEKIDLIPFMVTDLQQAKEQIDQCLPEANNPISCADAAQNIAELADSMHKTAQFFDLHALTALIDLLASAASPLPNLTDEARDEILPRLAAVNHLISLQADALSRNTQRNFPIDTLTQRLETLIAGNPLPPDVAGQHNNDHLRILEIDQVIAPAASAPADPNPTAQDQSDTDPSSQPTTDQLSTDQQPQTTEKAATTKAIGQQTIRVEVQRLEELLNLVGQLVLNKNRLLAQARQLRELDLPHEMMEHFTAAASELDSLTSQLQVGVMRTRMQPLAKLFDRYPRVIRDIARTTDKKINLNIVGKQTEVDKTVLELLADPLVHMLRNSADHGIEQPDVRTQANKPETGTIRLTAEHQGSHVRVEITDDGNGLDRKVIGDKAIERGLTTSDQLAALSDEDVFRFIFAPGFSTAAKVSDLSGRGVGMDVVRTNIAKLNGSINITATKGQRTTLEILIPLTVAIMPAMVVSIGRHLYAIPLTCITEIVRPDEHVIHSINNHPVLTLRDSVLPLLDMRQKLDESGPDSPSKFAVVVCVGQQQAGLVVDRLVGQQEIVIKPLDDEYSTEGPFSGATIREDGQVSLILDIIKLIRQSQEPERAAA